MIRRVISCRPVGSRGATAANQGCRSQRQGFSLIEVILATAILMGSVIVLARLAGMGRTTSQKAQRSAEAQRICEQLMNEIVLGLRPLEPVQQAAFQPLEAVAQKPTRDAEPGSAAGFFFVQQGQSQWTYSVQTRPLEELQGLTLLSVLVNSVVPEGRLSRPTSFQLSRWVRVPEAGDSVPENASLFGASGLFGDNP